MLISSMATFPFHGSKPVVGLSLLITEVSRSHSDTPLLRKCGRHFTKLYLTTNDNQKRRTSFPGAGFEAATQDSERPQTYVLNIMATGIGTFPLRRPIFEGGYEPLSCIKCRKYYWLAEELSPLSRRIVL
jgi:hypothetical protein